MTVTLRDVAQRAGVSNATVSRVLAGRPHVSDETRGRVLAAVADLAYRPDRVARSLRVRRSSILGLVITDIQNPFFTALVRAVEDVAYEHNYAVFLCNSDEDVEKEEFYIDVMLAESVAGVVIVPTQEKNTPCQKLVQAGIPLVSVDRRILDLEVDTVTVDNREASFSLVNRLLEAGHRRIGAVFGPMATTTGRERRDGYVQALHAHGIAVSPSLIRTGPPKKDSGYRAAKEILALSPPPSALFTGNNLLLMGALKAIRDNGLRVPQDLTLASFDEMDWMDISDLPLTVIAQPTYQLGRTAAELVLQRIQDRSRAVQQVTLTTKLREIPARAQGRTEV